MTDSASNTPLSDRFNLGTFTDGLISDLQLLREGKISIRDAQARAVLAKQILRSVHYVITAQKFLETQAKAILGPGDSK